MGKYIKSYLVFILSTLAVMFCIGFVMGIFSIFFASSPHELQASLQGGAIQLIIQLISVVVGFYCFRYSVRRFVEDE